MEARTNALFPILIITGKSFVVVKLSEKDMWYDSRSIKRFNIPEELQQVTVFGADLRAYKVRKIIKLRSKGIFFGFSLAYLDRLYYIAYELEESGLTDIVSLRSLVFECMCNMWSFDASEKAELEGKLLKLDTVEKVALMLNKANQVGPFAALDEV